MHPPTTNQSIPPHRPYRPHRIHRQTQPPPGRAHHPAPTRPRRGAVSACQTRPHPVCHGTFGRVRLAAEPISPTIERVTLTWYTPAPALLQKTRHSCKACCKTSKERKRSAKWRPYVNNSPAALTSPPAGLVCPTLVPELATTRATPIKVPALSSDIKYRHRTIMRRRNLRYSRPARL